MKKNLQLICQFTVDERDGADALQFYILVTEKHAWMSTMNLTGKLPETFS